MDAFHEIALFSIGLLALAAGLLLFFRPDVAARLNRPLHRAFPGINASIRPERYYYRHHRITGPATMAGGLLLLLISLYLPGIGFFAPSHPAIHPMFRDAAAIFAAVSGLCITVFGLVVFIRPSALKRFESTVNQPVTRERIASVIDRVRHCLAAFTETRPRLAGALIAACGILILLLFLL